MDAALPWIVLLLVLAVVLGSLGWLAGRVRRRGGGRELMGPIDLMYRPYTQQLNQEIVIVEQRADDAPAPGDPLRHARDEPD